MNFTDKDQWQKDLAAKINAADNNFTYQDDNALAEISELDTTWSRIKNMLKTNHLAMFSLIVIILIVLIAIFSPLLVPCDPYAIALADRAIGPTKQHLLGTDEFGRDILSRLMLGSRVSIVVGLVPTTISMTLGTVLGLVAGYVGGKADFIIMRIADVALAFPSLLFAMLVSYTIGQNLLTIFVALSIISWAGTARIIRAQTLQLREKEFVEAAVSIGVKKSTIIFKHILPNCVPNLIVLFTMNVPGNILSESSLSFLGVGAQPPSTSWGLMVNKMKEFLSRQPVGTLAPGVVILILVLAFNFLGDGLRDAIDPTLKD